MRGLDWLGHSLGVIKAAFTLAADDPPRVERLVAVSPPRLSYAYFCQTPRGEEFRQTFAAAEERVAAGRGDELMLVKFPLAYYVMLPATSTATGRGSALQRALASEPCCGPVPTLVTYGTNEVQGDLAFRGMPEAVEELRHRGESVARGRNCRSGPHIYGLSRWAAERIGSWLRRS